MERLVLWGRCYEGEATRPYGPFVEALTDHARTATADALRADLGSAPRRWRGWCPRCASV